VKNWHAKVVNAHRDMVEYAIHAGEGLAKGKAQCKHGTWMKWVADNFDFSLDTANVYRKIAKSEHAKNLPPETSLREALRIISHLAQPPAPVAEETCLWGSIFLPLKPNTPALPERSVEDEAAWTAMMANTWKTTLRKAVNDVDRSIDLLVTVANQKHQKVDVKTHARLAEKISKWIDALAELRAELELENEPDAS
jgi:Protein of unknown function (DUF3102)